MEESFYAERMRDKFGIEVIVPSPPSDQLVPDVIYQTLPSRPTAATLFRRTPWALVPVMYQHPFKLLITSGVDE